MKVRVWGAWVVTRVYWLRVGVALFAVGLGAHLALEAAEEGAEVTGRAPRTPAVDASASPKSAAPERLPQQHLEQLVVRVEDRGAPVRGARVRLVDPRITRYGERSELEQTTTSDAQGRAVFRTAPGRYYVRADVGGRSLPAVATVEPDRPSELTIDMSRAGRSLAVRVVDRSGRPLAGAFMDVSMPGIAWRGMPSARTGADGVARFEDLPPGRAELHVNVGDQWRMVRASGEAAELVWTPPREVRVAGTVRRLGAPFSGEVLVAVVLDDVVTFEVAAVEGGRLDARLSAPDGAGVVYVVPREEDLAPVAVGVVESGAVALDAVDVDFERGGELSGRVLLADGSEGVPARLIVEGPLGGVVEARAQWRTDSANDPWITVNEWAQATELDGTFRLTGLPSGPLALTAEGVGCRPATVSCALESAGAQSVGVAVRPR